MKTPPSNSGSGGCPRLALSPAEAADSFGVSRDFFDEHIAPELPWMRKGRLKRVALKELERWLESASSLTLERNSDRG